MDASQQLWVSDDLLEYLLSMLDLPTMVAFASVNPLAVSVLSRPTMWRRFFKRTYHMNMNTKSFQEEANEVIKARQKAPMIADILKMMECKESRLLELLDHICQAFPVVEDKNSDFYDGEIKLSFGGSSRTISPTSFKILDSIVLHLEPNMIEVEEVTLFTDPKFLESQIIRQQAEVKTIKITYFEESSDSDSFLAVIEKYSSWEIERFEMYTEDDEDEPNWIRWAEVSDKGTIKTLVVHGLGLGCPETVRKVWLATKEMIIHVGSLPKTYARENQSCYAYIRQEEGENGWARILKMIEEKDQIIGTRK